MHTYIWIELGYQNIKGFEDSEGFHSFHLELGPQWRPSPVKGIKFSSTSGAPQCLFKGPGRDCFEGNVGELNSTK